MHKIHRNKMVMIARVDVNKWSELWESKKEDGCVEWKCEEMSEIKQVSDYVEKHWILYYNWGTIS